MCIRASGLTPGWPVGGQPNISKRSRQPLCHCGSENLLVIRPTFMANNGNIYQVSLENECKAQEMQCKLLERSTLATQAI